MIGIERESFKLQITNTSDRKMLFRLEPWGDEKELLANESVIIRTEGPSGDVMKIEYAEDSITAYGSEGSLCEVEELAREI